MGLDLRWESREIREVREVKEHREAPLRLRIRN